MTTKNYLSQVCRLNRMIQNKLVEIYQLKTMACNVSVSNDGERVQNSGDKDRMGTTVAKIVDLEKETTDMVNNYTEKRKHIITQIDNIEDSDLYHLLSLRYVSGNTFEEIATKTNWSIRTVFNLHEKALKEFEKLYGEEYL